MSRFSNTYARLGWPLLCLLFLTGLSSRASQYFAQTLVQVRPASVDVDLRLDQEGNQYTASTLKNIPFSFRVVGISDGVIERALVRITGPGLDDALELESTDAGLVEFPGQLTPGAYVIDAVELRNLSGELLASRELILTPPVITVLDEVLVTEVTSRPLTTDEIAEKGIVVDEDSFQVLNFAVGMQIDGEDVEIELPIALPSQGEEEDSSVVFNQPLILDDSGFDALEIPNLGVTGFTLTPSPEDEGAEEETAPISGLMIIPGDIAYLNQFFSVMLIATNIANPGSDIVIEAAAARIKLPAGDDGLLTGDGDDPLRLATTDPVQADDKMLMHQGTSDISPGATHQAEFLVEGLREGTHVVEFDLSGSLRIPGADATPLVGTARGVVQVRNPTFTLNMVHPNVVRVDEPYRLYATVTNTSSSPANLFSLSLDPRGLMGARLAEGETGRRTVETLAAGETYEFAFDLVATATGEVTASVYLADAGINGAFLLKTGVGDTGIPLSPDTLVLPSSVDYLPKEPDLTRAAIRLLGHAYSNATAPAGSLPDGVERIAEILVEYLGSELAMQGLYQRFGEGDLNASIDILLAFSGAQLTDLRDEEASLMARIADYETLGGPELAGLSPEQKAVYAKLKSRLRVVQSMVSSYYAFDHLRRTTLAGEAFDGAVTTLVAQNASSLSVAAMLERLSERSRSSGGVLTAFHVSSSAELSLEIEHSPQALFKQDLLSGPPTRESLPFVTTMPWGDADDARLLLIGGEEKAPYTMQLAARSSGDASFSLLFSAGSLQCRLESGAISVADEQSLSWTIPEAEDCPATLAIQRVQRGEVVETIEVSVVAVTDEGPHVISAQQWAKGPYPAQPMLFEDGDPHGRMVFALLNERVAENDTPSVMVGEKRSASAHLQRGGRLVAYMLNEPLGMQSELTGRVLNLVDPLGNRTDDETIEVTLDPARGQAARVRGQVVDPRGVGVPFAEIEHFAGVFCQMCNWGEGKLLEVRIASYTADINGYYEIDYVLQNGYGDLPHIRVVATDPVSETTGEAISDVLFDGQDMRLDILLRGYGDIRGQLVDLSGNPLAFDREPVVTARHLQGGDILAPVIFDDGSFAVRGQIGPVLIQAAGWIGEDFYSGVASVLIPELDAEVSVLVGMMGGNTYGSVSGRVLENDALTGAANVKLQIRATVFGGIDSEGARYVPQVVGSTETSEDGFFEFPEVPAGNFEIYAYRQSTWEQVRGSGMVAEGGETSLTLLLPGSGGVVEGEVRNGAGELVAGARVVAGPFESVSDENGMFRISGLPRVDGINVGAQDTLSPAAVSQLLDLSVQAYHYVVLQFEKVGSLEGQVFESDGATTVEDNEVQLWATNETTGAPLGVLSTTTTDENGVYRFRAAPTGSYLVRSVKRSNFDGGERELVLSTHGQALTGIDIVLDGLGTVRGRVMQQQNTQLTPIMAEVKIRARKWEIRQKENGNGIPNPYVEFVDALREVDFIDPQMVDDAFYSQISRPSVTAFFIPTTETRTVTSNINIDTTDNPGEFIASGVLSGPIRAQAGNVFTSIAVSEVHLSADQDLDLGDLVVEPRTGRLSGRVLMPDGTTPFEGTASFDFSGALQGTPLETTGGEYLIAVAPEGPFRLHVATAAASCPDGEDDCVYPTQLFGDISGNIAPQSDMTMDVRLRGVGDVQVQVVDPDGQPVLGALATLTTVYPYDGDAQTALSDADGIVRFRHVIEGGYTVSVRLAGTPRWVSQSFAMPENPAVEHLDSYALVLPAADGTGSDSDQHVNGTIYGEIRDEQGQLVQEPTSVTLRTGNNVAMTLATDGTYLFETIPAGPFSLSSRDEVYGRRAFGEGVIASGATDVEVHLVFMGLGDVQGRVVSSSGDPVPGAFVTAYPIGAQERRRSTMTDADGNYAFHYIPVGEVRLTAKGPAGVLGAEAIIQIREPNETVFRELTLEEGYEIAGRIVLKNGDPAPNTMIQSRYSRKDGPTVYTQADGSFQFTTVFPPGELTLYGSLDARRFTEVFMLDSSASGLTNLELVLGAQGSLVARLVDSSGDGLVGARATLTSSTGSGQTGTTGAEGAILFTQVPEGELELSFQSPNVLVERARWTGRLDNEGQEVNAGNVALEALVSLSGVLMREDGVTPADGEILTLQKAGASTLFRRSANSDGSFLFEALPAGEYSLQGYNDRTECRVRLRRVISDLTEDVDLGTIAQDCQSPVFVSSVPEAYASGVDPGVTIELNFSEDIDPESAAQSVSLWQGSIEVSAVTSTSGSRVLIAPAQVLPGFTLHRVQVDGGLLEDVAGHSLGTNLQLSFTTGDGQPPVLLQSLPADGAIEVDTESIVLTFNEPVQVESFNATLKSGGSTYPVTATWNAQGDVVALTRNSQLESNRLFDVDIAPGLRDLGGNPTIEPISLNFKTKDRSVPSIASIAVEGELSIGSTITLVPSFSVPPSSAGYFGRDDVARVEYQIGETRLLASEMHPYSVSFELTMADVDSGSQLQVFAQSFDQMQNMRSKSLSFDTLVDTPPSVEWTYSQSAEVTTSREDLRFVFKTLDDRCLDRLEIAVTGGMQSSQSIAAGGCYTSKTITFDLSLDPMLRHGSSVIISVQAFDSVGQSSAVLSKTLPVRDDRWPELELLSPQQNDIFEPGEVLDVLFRTSDIEGIKEVRQGSSNGIYFESLSEVDESGYFSARVRMSTNDDARYSFSVGAEDFLGNTKYLTVYLKTRDYSAPYIRTVRQSSHPGFESRYVRYANVDPILLIEFDEPVKVSSVHDKVVLYDVTDGVSATIEWAPESLAATPEFRSEFYLQGKNLVRGNRYRVRVLSGIEDAHGNLTSEDLSTYWHLTVSPQPGGIHSPRLSTTRKLHEPQRPLLMSFYEAIDHVGVADGGITLTQEGGSAEEVNLSVVRSYLEGQEKVYWTKPLIPLLPGATYKLGMDVTKLGYTVTPYYSSIADVFYTTPSSSLMLLNDPDDVFDDFDPEGIAQAGELIDLGLSLETGVSAEGASRELTAVELVIHAVGVNGSEQYSLNIENPSQVLFGEEARKVYGVQFEVPEAWLRAESRRIEVGFIAYLSDGSTVVSPNEAAKLFWLQGTSQPVGTLEAVHAEVCLSASLEESSDEALDGAWSILGNCGVTYRAPGFSSGYEPAACEEPIFQSSNSTWGRFSLLYSSYDSSAKARRYTQPGAHWLAARTQGIFTIPRACTSTGLIDGNTCSSLLKTNGPRAQPVACVADVDGCYCGIEWQGSIRKRGSGGSSDFKQYDELLVPTNRPPYTLRIDMMESDDADQWSDTTLFHGRGWRKGHYWPLEIRSHGYDVGDLGATQYMQEKLLFVEDSQ